MMYGKLIELRRLDRGDIICLIQAWIGVIILSIYKYKEVI